uniref:Uncharacterized protein n=1 Tax=Strongyloides venezuelensis TaxID=75913 RepID=A0A0K0FJ08_STRVS
MYVFTLCIDKDFLGFLPDTLLNFYKNISIKPTILGSLNVEARRDFKKRSIENENNFNTVSLSLKSTNNFQDTIESKSDSTANNLENKSEFSQFVAIKAAININEAMIKRNVNLSTINLKISIIRTF